MSSGDFALEAAYWLIENNGLDLTADLRDEYFCESLVGIQPKKLSDLAGIFLHSHDVYADEKTQWGPPKWQYHPTDKYDTFDYYARNGCKLHTSTRLRTHTQSHTNLHTRSNRNTFPGFDRLRCLTRLPHSTSHPAHTRSHTWSRLPCAFFLSIRSQCGAEFNFDFTVDFPLKNKGALLCKACGHKPCPSRQSFDDVCVVIVCVSPRVMAVWVCTILIDGCLQYMYISACVSIFVVHEC